MENAVLPGTDRYVRAARALAAAGDASFGVRELIEAAGGSRKSFYASFGGKDDLLCAMFAEDCQIGAQILERMVARRRSPEQRLRAWVEGLFRLMAAGDAGYVRVLVREHRRLAETRPDAIDAAVAPFVDLLASILPGPHHAPAVFHLTLLRIHDAALGRVEDLDAAVDDLVAFCWSGAGGGR